MLPVVWIALLIAPYWDRNIFELISRMDEVLAEPWHIQWSFNSLKAILFCLFAYAMCIGIWLSTRRNYRHGEEHGSAKWGDAAAVNRKYRQKPDCMNKILTQNVRIGFDGRKHRRNPYEYLEYVLKWQDLAVGALDRQIGRAKNSILGNLQALKEADLNEDDRRLFFTKINQYGGIKLLDSLTREQSLEVSRRYISIIQALPIVENGKSILVKNIENGNTMRFNVENGKLIVGKTEIRTTDRLLRRRKGSVIDINKGKWQIVDIR